MLFKKEMFLLLASLAQFLILVSGKEDPPAQSEVSGRVKYIVRMVNGDLRIVCHDVGNGGGNGVGFAGEMFSFNMTGSLRDVPELLDLMQVIARHRMSWTALG